MSFLIDAYPWIKALHIISIIAWMAGLLYLPRLFVYHASENPTSATAKTLTVMEAKLARLIILPAMIASLIFGLLLLAIPGWVDMKAGWFHTKLLMVFGLLVFQHFSARWRRGLKEGTNTHSAGFFRAVNEIPTALMIIIVIMVVVKPF